MNHHMIAPGCFHAIHNESVVPQTVEVFDYVLTKGGGDVVFDHCMCLRLCYI